ncbi:MAG: hypothetical protein Q8Q01_03430, partial [archaeon]|nr:hypothetical protein [archaeon]
RLISQSLNDDQRRLVERVYGKGDDFEKVRAMLTERSEVKIRVFVLNQNYVRSHASAGAIGRASWLNSSSFSAVDYDIGSRNRLRGVVSSERSENNSVPKLG